jgi:enoyl-CoA hydratase/carnithine racemase
MKQFDYEYLDVRVEDRVCWIKMEREHPPNAFCSDMYLEIKNAVRLADWSPVVDYIVLTGSGGAFGVGGDLHEVLGAVRDFRDGGLALHKFQDNLPFETIRCAQKIVISAVNGLAVGAGLSLATIADISIAVKSAKLGAPDSKSGALDSYLPYYLFGQVPLAKLKYLLYTGKMIDAEEAERIGLITEVVEDDKLEERVHEVIEELRGGSLGPNAEFKRILGRLVDYSLAEHMQGAARTWQLLMSEEAESRLSRFERAAAAPADAARSEVDAS